MMPLDRTIQPELFPVQHVELNIPEHFRLNNGIPVWYLNLGSQDVLRVEFIFPAGTACHENQLVPSFANSMLQEGTRQKSAAEIADAIDKYGAFLELDTEKDYAFVTLYTLKRYYNETLPMVIEMIGEANFPEREWNIQLSNRLDSYRINSRKVSFLASKGFQELLFSGTPYGAKFSEESYTSAKRSDVLEFYGKNYAWGRAMLMLSGKVDESVIESTKRIVGALQFDEVPVEQASSWPEASMPGERLHFIERTDAIQSALRIGRRMFNRNHPDFFGMKILSTVLGGYFGSRLMTNIREDKGYTYGIGSGMMSFKNDGWFYISTEVGADVTNDALKEIYHELEVLRNELIPADELELVRNYMLGSLLKSFDGPFEQIDRYKAVLLFGVDEGYQARFTEAIRNLDAVALRSLAQTYLQEKDLLELVVGKK
jgi:predicted Zn-dependent peptidase